MVEFICNRSGNKVSFTRPDDIVSMRKQDGYTEVTNETEAKANAEKAPAKENGESYTYNSNESKDEKGKQEANVLKKQRGRPKKREN